MKKGALFKQEVKHVEAEIKKAKAYFKRTNDLRVEIRADTYLELLNFKRKVLQRLVKETKREEKK